ncbi:glycosyltransferase family 2 protein [Paraflavitalea soli]|uniref:Glycosyltransferase family 2 protein n=1 Tax=Paraflavitalea soli TaxID=2315862 RepID=A0A3B7MV35_9BACT|nr:glycosyltransferase family 2 protein [Paraflavitalea soli]AXY77099.1 glycosyltransferase family 2 protein [Paraflavitalea soli]
MQPQPLVSVLMTMYNREKYVAEAIESVLASSWKDLELIIVDDTSTDRSVSIAQSYAEKDNRIRLYVNERNLGDYNNRNKAAGYAKGKYLKYLDSDDTIYPWGLEAMVWCMEKEPAAGFGLMSYSASGTKPFPLLLSPADAYRAFFFKGALITMGPAGAIFKREAFEAVQGFSGKPYVGDSEMWLKMSRRFPLIQMPPELIWWRQHEGQQISEGHKNNYYAINQFKIYKEAILHPDCPLSKDECEMALRNLKNLRAREIIFRKLFKVRWKQAFMLLRESDMNAVDLIKGARRNQYPNGI